MDTIISHIQWRIQNVPGGAHPKLGDDNLLFGQIFSKKVHENEENRTGAVYPKFYYVDLPLQTDVLEMGL